MVGGCGRGAWGERGGSGARPAAGPRRGGRGRSRGRGGRGGRAGPGPGAAAAVAVGLAPAPVVAGWLEPGCEAAGEAVVRRRDRAGRAGGRRGRAVRRAPQGAPGARRAAVPPLRRSPGGSSAPPCRRRGAPPTLPGLCRPPGPGVAAGQGGPVPTAAPVAPPPSPPLGMGRLKRLNREKQSGKIAASQVRSLKPRQSGTGIMAGG